MPLEQFYKDSIATGVKVGEDLRGQVRQAIELLGNGFLDGELIRLLTGKDEHVKREDVKREDVKREDVKREDVKRQDVKRENVDIVMNYVLTSSTPAEGSRWTRHTGPG